MGKRIVKTQRTYTGKEIPFATLFPLSPGKCRRCGEPLPPGRRSWCSDNCRNLATFEIEIKRGRSSTIRKALFKRDAGICAGCACDTERRYRALRAAYWSLCSYYSGNHPGIARLSVTALIVEFVAPDFPGTFSHIWEADHIKAVVNGGQHDLSNLQTLCIPCHRLKTHADRQIAKYARSFLQELEREAKLLLYSTRSNMMICSNSPVS